MSDQYPYASLRAKGEDRRQRILAVAQRLLTSQGWRNTTVGQIAREAGVSPAGLLYHFQSKEQLLHALVEARDAKDNANRVTTDDVIEQIDMVGERFRHTPDVIGMFIVLLVENLDSGAPLHDYLLYRSRSAIDILAEGIRNGPHTDHRRADVDPSIKAGEIIAFLYGMEALWLLDPSTPVTKLLEEYTRSLKLRLTGTAPDP